MSSIKVVQRMSWALALLFAGISTVGCANYVSITRKMVKDNSFTDEELQLLQYYNSEDILLERKATRAATLTDGKLLGKGRVVEVVEIDELTPGVVERIELKQADLGQKGIVMWVSFEPGSAIPFISYELGIYALYAPEGTVTLGKKVYTVKRGQVPEKDQQPPHLMIEADALDAIRQKRVLPGRRLNDR